MDHLPKTLQQGLLRSAFFAALVGVATSSAAPPCAAGSLSWRHGEHRLELSLAARLRAEFWDAHATDGDWFTGLRTRLGARYSYGEHVTLFAELQDARVNRLDADSSGAGALYRTHSGGGSHAHHDRIRQLWLELRPRPDFTLKLGRQDIKLGSEVLYSEPDWNYLKLKRLSERLVGTVGWTLAERANDGASFAFDRNGHLLYAFAARPTTGVFDIDSAYASQEDILYGGISWTVKRGTWLDDGELRFFGLWYEDERELAPGGVAPGNDVEIWTLGFSLLCVRSLGPGKADFLTWAALQTGDWNDLDHRGYALAVEMGYRFPAIRAEPWLRIGVNLASGDGDPGDGDHESFFNLLPTNHLYYGYADRLALANLVDVFGQVRLTPIPRTSLELVVHHFSLLTDDDGRHFGTGAFNKTAFGFGTQASGGHRSIGTELDLVLSLRLHERVVLQAGYAFLEGHALFNDLSDDDVRFGYLQLSARY